MNHFRMKTSPFLIPVAQSVTEQEIQKSRFITYISHTSSLSCAKALINQIKSEHSSAHHHCWGHIAGRPDDSMCLGFSDDGEPAGTAGKPILAQLMGSGIGEITAIVVRYYGGIRLGTGGLVKAYGGGVKKGLSQLITQEKYVMVHLTLHCEYTHITWIENLLSISGGVLRNIDFSHTVMMTVDIDSRQADTFTAELIHRSRGKISIAFTK